MSRLENFPFEYCRSFQPVKFINRSFEGQNITEYLRNQITEYENVKTQLLEQYALRRKCIEMNIGQSLIEIAETYAIIAWAFTGLFILSISVMLILCSLLKKSKESDFRWCYVLVALVAFIAMTMITVIAFAYKLRNLDLLIKNPLKYGLIRLHSCSDSENTRYRSGF